MVGRGTDESLSSLDIARVVGGLGGLEPQIGRLAEVGAVRAGLFEIKVQLGHRFGVAGGVIVAIGCPEQRFALELAFFD